MGSFFSKVINHVAIFDYEAVQSTQLSVQKGDVVRIIDTVNDDWSQVLHLKNKQKGLVPTNFLAKQNSLEAEE